MAQEPTLYYGGQAVMEGVMMRGRRHSAIAVRRPDGTIAIRRDTLGAAYTGRARDLPFIRGLSVLAETLVLGSRALLWSTNVVLGKESEGISKRQVATMMGFSLTFVAVIFFAGPVLLSDLLYAIVDNDFFVVFVEGVLRLAMLLAYLWLIGLMPDVRRVFAYHGAEHMTIHAYENGSPLTVEGVRPYPQPHTRCGTSFLLVVMVVSVLVFTAMGSPDLWLRVLSRIVLIPVIAAISYEVIRLGARYRRKRWVAALFSPNLALQRLTTRVPDDSMIEVAIASFKEVVEAEGLSVTGEGFVVTPAHQAVAPALDQQAPEAAAEAPPA